MRKFDLRLNSRHALTWGFDGFVIGRCNEFKEEIGMALPHHRHYGGVKKAYMDVSGKFIISLGRDEILTCTDLVENIYDMLCYKESVILMESPRFLIMFRTKTTGFQPEGKEAARVAFLSETHIFRQKKCCFSISPPLCSIHIVRCFSILEVRTTCSFSSSPFFNFGNRK